MVFDGTRTTASEEGLNWQGTKTTGSGRVVGWSVLGLELRALGRGEREIVCIGTKTTGSRKGGG